MPRVTLLHGAVTSSAIGLALASCGSGGSFPDAPAKDAPPPTGTIRASWSIQSSAATPLTCAQVQGVLVTATIENIDAVGGTDTIAYRTRLAEVEIGFACRTAIPSRER